MVAPATRRSSIAGAGADAVLAARRPRPRDPRRHARTDRDRSLFYPCALARTLFRYLGRRIRPALLYAAFAPRGAQWWRRLDAGNRDGWGRVASLLVSRARDRPIPR